MLYVDCELMFVIDDDFFLICICFADHKKKSC